MPSAPSGRYQSRLFNFVNRQSQRLTDQYDRAVRQLKVTAVWGVQILLYPVYLMVQAGLSAGRQLAQSAEAGWPQFKALTNAQPQQETPPAADTPIQQVLAAVNTLSAGVGSWDKRDEGKEEKGIINAVSFSPNHQSLISNSPSSLDELPEEIVAATNSNLNQINQELSKQSCLIQGVATLLENRTLVLVTVDNQILDILPPQQQQKLSSKISWEIADLRRQWRLAAVSARPPLTQRRFSSRESQPRVLAPVRLFWHLMAWVQTSPVAIAANLFQEATLVENISISSSSIPPRRPALPPQQQQPVLNGQEIPPQLAPQSQIGFASAQGAIAFLDRTVAELESHQLVPGSEVVVSLSETATRSIKEHTQKLRQQLQAPFIKQDSHPTSPEGSQTGNLGIMALISAAVDYFFGRQQRLNLPGTDSPEPSAVIGNSQAEIHQLSGHQSTALPSAKELSKLKFADNTEPDPWLSWDDLYGNPQTANSAQNPTSYTQGKNKKKSPAQLPEAFNSKMPVKRGNSVLGAIKRYLGFKQPPGKLSAPSINEVNVEESVTMVVQPPTKLKNRSEHKSSTAKKLTTSFPNAVKSGSTKSLPDKTVASAITTPTSDGHLDAAPDWIETPATPNGYVKHPLEQLLAWLDTVMLWLEELVVKVWRWLRGR